MLSCREQAVQQLLSESKPKQSQSRAKAKPKQRQRQRQSEEGDEKPSDELKANCTIKRDRQVILTAALEFAIKTHTLCFICK